MTTENTQINWKSKIPKEYLYVNYENKQKLSDKYKKPFDELTVDNVDERDLVITLAGIRYVANLKGYTSVNYIVSNPSPEYACVTCQITFKEDDKLVIFSDSASAWSGNTSGNIYPRFLVECATNRAFCRTVRAYLNIQTVSSEELGQREYEPVSTVSPIKQENNSSVEEPKSNSLTPHGALQNRLDSRNKTFEQLKKSFTSEKMNIDGKFDFLKEANVITDLTVDQAREMLGAIAANNDKKK